MKTSTRYSLSAHDSRTSRLELLAFSGLGLAGAILIMGAITSALRFAENREGIIQALSAPGAAQAELARGGPDQTPTNRVRAHSVAARMQPGASLQTPDSAGSEPRKPQGRLRMDGALPRWSIERFEW